MSRTLWSIQEPEGLVEGLALIPGLLITIFVIVTTVKLKGCSIEDRDEPRKNG
jgi:hypothetical protein